MFKILKWTAASAIILAVGGWTVFGSDAFSYLTTAVSSARDHVKEQIPIEFELERAEEMVEAIEPEIRRCERDVAEAEVDLRELSASVGDLRDTITQEEAFIRARSAVLSSGTGGEGYALASVPSQRIARSELERVFDSFRSHSEILKAKEARIVQQSEMVTAAKQRLASVASEKAQLEQQIVSLRQQKQWLDAVAAESSKFDLDDSQLAQARKALESVKRRLNVTQQMIQNRAYYNGEALVGASDPQRDILGEIEDHFSDAGARGALSESKGR